MLRKRVLLPLICLVALSACNFHPKERTMPDFPDLRADLAFTCAYEKDRIPPRDPEADQLYKHARWLRKNNLLKPQVEVYRKIERLVRIATTYGHDRANIELRAMLGKGQAESDDIVKETLDLTEELIRRGIPASYYDMGYYLEKGYGVKQDYDLALKYFRKAADLGNPEGQYKVGEMLSPINVAPEIAVQMWQCAAEQGHGEAANSLGIHLKNTGHHAEAVKAFQLGIKAGDSLSAFKLEKAFNAPPLNDRMDYLALPKDEERVRRYHLIGGILFDYDYLHPKVPELDQIVPLPPAKLPPWDGKLKWLEEHQANVPPQLPSEERIVEMARAKGLDPETGRPLKAKR